MQIKNCPFCGDTADLFFNYGRHGYFVYVECDLCKAKGAAFSFGRELPNDWIERFPSEKAIRSWNRRAYAEQNT